MSTIATDANPSDDSDSNKRFSKEIVKLIRKPANWRRRSTAPFYKERFALEVKEQLDKMAADPEKKDLWYLYEDFKRWYVPSSLYNYINQSLRYLQDYLDPDLYYRRLLETIGIRREKNKGVCLFFHADIKQSAGDKPVPVSVAADEPTYMKEINEWLAEPHESGERKVISGLALADDEVAKVNELFECSEVVAVSVTCKSITLVML